MIFNLFFKSEGNKSTLGTSTNYFNTISEINVENMEDLRKIATEIVDETGLPINNFDVDIKNAGVPYDNPIKTTDELENYNVNDTRRLR